MLVYNIVWVFESQPQVSSDHGACGLRAGVGDEALGVEVLCELHGLHFRRSEENKTAPSI